MKYVKLGSTGLDVSRLCLGCMTFGDPDAGMHPWTDDSLGQPVGDVTQGKQKSLCGVDP